MANKKLHSQIQKAKKGGLSMVELAHMKAIAQKKAEECERVAQEKAFVLMLGIPLAVLVEDYWNKSAKSRIPKFIEDCMSAYESVLSGTLTYEDLAEMIREYADVEIEAEWLKCKEAKDVTE